MLNMNVVIAGAKRTAIGSLLGQFTGVPATKLGATAIYAALEQSSVRPSDVSDVIMGCVLPANLGQAPARQAALEAGLAASVGCTTINKVCGSGLKALMFGHDQIKAGSATIVVAGGMESMTNAPHLVQARRGIRYGHGELIDHMAWDGLTNPYDGKAMGVFGELCAQKYQFTREDQDAFAIESLTRAQHAQKHRVFADEIVAVTMNHGKREVIIDSDEAPQRSDISKIHALKPVFDRQNGTITAATASSISDGAAALVLLAQHDAEDRGMTNLVRIVAHASHAQAPEWFTTAPIQAIQKVLDQAKWQPDDVDLFEINEAFAVVPMAAMRELGITHDRLNVRGGACALGHPIGASGARVVVTLIRALQSRGMKRGVAALCIGGGEGIAIAVECMD